MKGTLEDFSVSKKADGSVDFLQIQINFNVLEARITNLESDMKMVRDRRSRFIRIALCEGQVPVTILKERDHEEVRLVSAFMQAADNIDIDQTIVITSGERELIHRKTLKSSEKSGKVLSFSLITHRTVGRYANVVAIPSSRRKTIIMTEWEEV